MPTKTKSNRGGKRHGAGRPKLPPELERTVIQASILKHSTLQKLVHQSLVMRDLDGLPASLGEVIDYLAGPIEADD